MVIAVALTLGTNVILRVQGLLFWVTLATIVVITFAVASLALGFGALFPKFDTENPAEIPTGFGGLLFMMCAITYLGVIIVLEAWPMITLLRAQSEGVAGPAHVTILVIGLTVAGVISLGAILLPLAAAVHRIESLDR